MILTCWCTNLLFWPSVEGIYWRSIECKYNIEKNVLLDLHCVNLLCGNFFSYFDFLCEHACTGLSEVQLCVCVYIYLITYNVAVKKIKFEYCGFPPRWLSDNYNFLYSFVLYLLPEPRHIYRLRKPEAWICTAESMNLYLLWQFET